MAVETTSSAAHGWAPDITYHVPGDVLPEALLLRASTVAASIEGDAPVVRATFIDDADAGFVAEGAEIPEADPDLDEIEIPTRKVSQLVKVSRELYGQPETANQLAQSVARALTRKADLAFVAQAAPVSPAVAPVAGLANQSGIVTSTARLDVSLDALVDMVAELQDNGALPSHLLVSPSSWALISKFKTGTGSNQALVSSTGVQEAAVLRLNGLEVVVNSAVPAGKALVVDSTAVISAAGQVMVAVSEHAAFSSDSILVRGTWRIGHGLPRADRLGILDVGPEA
ncbi:phage major capsid protein [Nocardia flavorosea]|uniref:phage major capsid protein n=1 Tax=Nocardia flavorosea TaxID=53429 RepID=UPI002455A48D|nr:phage major capsid protein [Nocardia flavorosea]